MERVVDCLNHGLNGLCGFHGLKSLDGRDLEKISIALIIHSLDLLRVLGFAVLNPTYGCWIWQSQQERFFRGWGRAKERGCLG